MDEASPLCLQSQMQQVSTMCNTDLCSAAHYSIGIGALFCRQVRQPVRILEQQASPVPWA